MNPLPKYNEKGELDIRLRVDPVTGDVGIGTPQSTWVGLTKEEINQGLLRSFYVLEKARAWRDGVAWAEEILKEKNNAV